MMSESTGIDTDAQLKERKTGDDWLDDDEIEGFQKLRGEMFLVNQGVEGADKNMAWENERLIDDMAEKSLSEAAALKENASRVEAAQTTEDIQAAYNEKQKVVPIEKQKSVVSDQPSEDSIHEQQAKHRALAYESLKNGTGETGDIKGLSIDEMNRMEYDIEDDSDEDGNPLDPDKVKQYYKQKLDTQRDNDFKTSGKETTQSRKKAREDMFADRKAQIKAAGGEEREAHQEEKFLAGEYVVEGQELSKRQQLAKNEIKAADDRRTEKDSLLTPEELKEKQSRQDGWSPSNPDPDMGARVEAAQTTEDKIPEQQAKHKDILAAYNEKQKVVPVKQKAKPALYGSELTEAEYGNLNKYQKRRAERRSTEARIANFTDEDKQAYSRARNMMAEPKMATGELQDAVPTPNQAEDVYKQSGVNAGIPNENAKAVSNTVIAPTTNNINNTTKSKSAPLPPRNTEYNPYISTRFHNF